MRMNERVAHALRVHLLPHAVAIGLMGLGLAVVASPIQASIIYTPAEIAVAQHTSTYLNLNHDDMVDVTFQIPAGCSMGTCGALLYAEGEVSGPLGTNLIQAGALMAGARIGPGEPMRSDQEMVSVGDCPYPSHPMCEGDSSPYVEGPWANVTDRYLGVRAQIFDWEHDRGSWHYGWVRLDVSVGFRLNEPPDIQATITGYALNLEPDKPIAAGQTTAVPEPSTVSSAALGGLCLTVAICCGCRLK
jgi:hypothetical protein